MSVLNFGSSSSSDEGSSEFIQIDRSRRHSWSHSSSSPGNNTETWKQCMGKLLNFSDDDASIDMSFDPFEGRADLALKKMATNSPTRSLTFDGSKRGQNKSVRFTDLETQAWAQPEKSSEIQLSSAESVRIKAQRADIKPNLNLESPERMTSSEYSDSTTANNGKPAVFKKSYSKIYGLHENSLQKKFSYPTSVNPYTESDTNPEVSLNDEELENMLLGNDHSNDLSETSKENIEEVPGKHQASKETMKSNEESLGMAFFPSKSNFTKHLSNNEEDITEGNLDFDDSNIVQDLVPKLREFKLTKHKKSASTGSKSYSCSVSSARSDVFDSSTLNPDKSLSSPLDNSSPIPRSPLNSKDPSLHNSRTKFLPVSQSDNCLSSTLSSSSSLDDESINQLKEALLMLQSMSPLENSLPFNVQSSMSETISTLLHLSKKASTKFYQVQNDYYNLSNKIMEKDTTLSRSYERNSMLEREISDLKEKINQLSNENTKIQNQWQSTSKEYDSTMHQVDRLAVQVHTVENSLKSTKLRLEHKSKAIEDIKGSLKTHYPRRKIESDSNMVDVVKDILKSNVQFKEQIEILTKTESKLQLEFSKNEIMLKESIKRLETLLSEEGSRASSIEQQSLLLEEEKNTIKHEFSTYQTKMNSKLEELYKEKKLIEDKLDQEKLTTFEKNEHFYEVEEQNQLLKSDLNKLVKDVEEADKELAKAILSEKSLNDKIQELESKISNQDNEIKKVENLLKQAEEECGDHNDEISVLNELVASQGTEINDHKSKISELENLRFQEKEAKNKMTEDISFSLKEVERLSKEISIKEEDITRLKSTVKQNENILSDLEAKIKELENDISNKKEEVVRLKEINLEIKTDKIEEMENMNNKINESTMQIHELSNNLRDVKHEYNKISNINEILSKDNEAKYDLINQMSHKIGEMDNHLKSMESSSSEKYKVLKDSYMGLIIEFFNEIETYLEEESTTEFKYNYNLIGQKGYYDNKDLEIINNFNKFLREGLRIIMDEIDSINQNNSKCKQLICTQQNEIDKLINKLEYSEEKIKKYKHFKNHNIN